MMPGRSLLATPTGRDSLLLLLARVIQMANGFALSVLLVRIFGLGTVGTYTVATIAMAALSQISAAGLNYLLPREDLSNQERNFVALWWAACFIAPVCLLVPLYGAVMARVPGEWLEITLFAWSGYFFGQTNVLNTLLLLDNNTRWSILPPVTNAVGILTAALTADTVVAFASVLLIFRALGNTCLFARLDYARVAPRAAFRYCWKGLKYSPMDLIAMLSEQIGPLIMAHSLTRAELGLFGLCQQLLAAADTPGWSVIQAHYPSLARSGRGIPQALRRTLLTLSLLMAALLSVGSFIIARYVYALPRLWPIMALLSLSLPWRYLNSFYDQVLRAAGRVRAGTHLAILKLLLSAMVFAPLVFFFGLWGAAGGLVLLSAISSVLYARKTVAVVGIHE
jgi:O-antigen/teichoic acid export membrane protein